MDGITIAWMVLPKGGEDLPEKQTYRQRRSSIYPKTGPRQLDRAFSLLITRTTCEEYPLPYKP